MKLVNDTKNHRGVCVVVDGTYFPAGCDADVLAMRFGINAEEFRALQVQVAIPDGMTDDDRQRVMEFINALPAA